MTNSKSILDCHLSSIYRLNNPVKRLISAPALSSLDKLMSLPTIRNYYHCLPKCDNPFNFIDNALEKLEIRYAPETHYSKVIPSSGPLIVVSNHPFGGIDGLILTSILSKARQDIRIIANHFLGLFPELKPILFPVNPFGHKSSVKTNARSLLKAASWVKDGGLLIVFPAGEVSHFSISRRVITNPPLAQYHRQIGAYYSISGASGFLSRKKQSVISCSRSSSPYFKDGPSSQGTHKKKIGQHPFKMGHPIPYKRLSEIGNIDTLTSYLRFRTELLGKSELNKNKILSFPLIRKKPTN